MIIFGGECIDDEGKITLLNDTWLVCLKTGSASALLTSHGAPPSPRMHHTCTLIGGTMLAVIGGLRMSDDGEQHICVQDALHLLEIDASLTEVYALACRTRNLCTRSYCDQTIHA